jgi:diaminopimelate decarboxylase
MTLAELLPSVGRSAEPPLAQQVWPVGTRRTTDGDLLLDGVPASSLAARYGTPVNVLVEADVRLRARAFAAALPEAEVVFASKALPSRAVLRWMAAEGLSLDVCSAGELAVARSVGFPAERILLHGNVKTPEDLKAALAYGVGRIVVDSVDEIDQLSALAPHGQAVLLRITPGVDAHTHAAITTGVDDQKFGFPLATAADAVARVLRTPGLRLAGLHCHIGSQVYRVAAYEEAVRRMVRFAVTAGVPLGQLDIGGGFAVPYLAADGEFDLTGYAHRVRVALRYECAAAGLPVPRLVVEPGRALVARAGVTLYRVITVKRGVRRTFVAVDGGMSDNPRPALYGSRYTVRLVGRHSYAAAATVTVVGRHCEAGDVLADDVPLAQDVHAGDLLAIATTGAYHHALASNYNLVGRPPLIGVTGGESRVLVRGETEEDVLNRDVG